MSAPRVVLCAFCVVLVSVIANAAPRDGGKEWVLSTRRLEQSAATSQSSVSFSPLETEVTSGPSFETEPEPELSPFFSPLPSVVTSDAVPEDEYAPAPESEEGLLTRPVCDNCPNPKACERCYCDTGECALKVQKVAGGQEVQSGVCANCRPKKKCKKKNLWWCKR